MSRCCFGVALIVAVAAPAAAQNRTDQLVGAARERIAARHWSGADSALTEALGAALYVMDSVNVFVWRGIYEYFRGNDSLARLSFRRALLLRQITSVRDLEKIDPGLAALFDAEARPFRVYRASELDEPAAWRSGPALIYPPELRPRRVAGHALVRAIIDTLGRVEEKSLLILDSPDPAFDAPLRRMMLAAQFTAGRVKGNRVRSQIDLGFSLNPPALENPTKLVTAARDQLRARRTDSALALTELALDSVNQASAAERVYALLVQGVAWHMQERDSLATLSLEAGLDGYAALIARGVDLAPVLKRLADSIRISRRGIRKPAAPPFAAPFGAPTVVGAVDEQPALISHPPIRYAPEMQKLRIGGTVIVEATLDVTGRVVPVTVRIVQSPNPVFDVEAKRVVLAAVYRPARIRGRPARVTIRQPITFAAY